jgi:hypothetical protein
MLKPVSVTGVPSSFVVGGVQDKLAVPLGGWTMTVTERLLLPPSPLQVNVKVVVLVRPLRVSLPNVVLVPDQPSKASQVVASVDDQLRMVEPPDEIEVGLAVSETVGTGGGGGASTVTTTDWLAEPPAPEQVNVNIADAVRGPTLSLPVVVLVPVQSSVASQSLASVDDQDSVVHSPARMLVGAAAKDTVGVGGGG